MDAIVGHSLNSMDAYNFVLSDESLREAMHQYRKWIDVKIEYADELLRKESNVNEISSG